MSVRKTALKGGLLLGGSQVASQVAAFLRNVIVARFLSPTDFGVAAVFAMTLNLFDLLNMSYEKLLIQAEDGHEERFQSTIQWMLLLRGAVTAALVFCTAGLVSRLFGVPNARWAFYCLALVPLVRGLGHLDLSRLQREMKYTAAVKVDMVTNILTLVIAWPIAYFKRDYSAMLWILIAKVGINVIASHCVASRPYSCSYYRQYVRRAFSFGWPLLLNGFLIFGIFQGDQFIIGSANRIFHHSFYSLADLGRYSVAFALTMAPTVIVANITSTLFLPLFARASVGSKEFDRRYAFCLEALALASASIAIAFIMCGGVIASAIYGHAYANISSFIGCLAAMQAMRILRVGPNQAAVARGDTKNAMISNCVRSLALFTSFAFASRGLALVWIAAAGVAGEILAFVVAVIMLWKKQRVSPAVSLKPAGIMTAILAVAVTLNLALTSITPMMRLSLTLLVELISFITIAGIFPDLRQTAATTVRDLFRWLSNFRLNGFKITVNP